MLWKQSIKSNVWDQNTQPMQKSLDCVPGTVSYPCESQVVCENKQVDNSILFVFLFPYFHCVAQKTSIFLFIFLSFSLTLCLSLSVFFSVCICVCLCVSLTYYLDCVFVFTTFCCRNKEWSLSDDCWIFHWSMSMVEYI